MRVHRGQKMPPPLFWESLCHRQECSKSNRSKTIVPKVWSKCVHNFLTTQTSMRNGKKHNLFIVKCNNNRRMHFQVSLNWFQLTETSILVAQWLRTTSSANLGSNATVTFVHGQRKIGWLVGWGLTALSAQTDYTAPSV